MDSWIEMNEKKKKKESNRTLRWRQQDDGAMQQHYDGRSWQRHSNCNKETYWLKETACLLACLPGFILTYFNYTFLTYAYFSKLSSSLRYCAFAVFTVEIEKVDVYRRGVWIRNIILTSSRQQRELLGVNVLTHEDRKWEFIPVTNTAAETGSEGVCETVGSMSFSDYEVLNST